MSRRAASPGRGAIRAVAAFLPLPVIATALLLAACGEPEDTSLFLRETPAHIHPPIRPAPELEDIRPVPDLQADRKALALLCAVSGWDAESCACIARSGTEAFRGSRLAYFAALVIGDATEAARVQANLTQETRATLAGEAETVFRHCGMI